MTNMPKSIFKYILTDANGIHTIPPQKFAELLADPDYDTTDLEHKLTGNQFPEGLKPTLVITPEKLKRKYNPALKKAIYKHREAHKKYRARVKEEKIKNDPDYVARGKGRPRKPQ